MDLSLFFAGTAGSVPTARRGLPATLMRRGGDRLLFDCGEGTQRQLLRTVGLPDMQAVFLTHHHADHWLGLPGMLKSFELRDRQAPLTVYGPPGTIALMRAMRIVYGRLRYPFEVVDLEPGDAVAYDGYEVAAFNVRHRGRAFGYAIVEEPRPGRFDAELATRLGVEFGPDFGRLQRGEVVNGVHPEQVVGPERPGRKLVLSGDTAPCDMLRVAAHEADVLVHEATFTDEEREPARAHPRLHALRRRRDPRRGARDLRAHRGPARLRQRRGALPREGRSRAAALRRRAGERVTGPPEDERTRVQPRPLRARRVGPLGIALAAAGGFLAGVLLIAILGGAKPVYKERTLTVSKPPQGSAVPALVGQRLDVALDRLQSAGLKGDVQGGGLFGVLDESGWKVVDQDPSPGARLSQGDTVRLDIDRA
jgi:ribonuclease Z